jgi:hyperosmotically inducible periplasmic protein
MKHMLCGLALAFAVSAFAVQQQSPTNPRPQTTPPTFPDDQASRQEMPPDTKAPPPRALSTAQVQRQIQDKLKNEPALASANVKVKTDDKAVTLTGTVDTEGQHELALRIAQSYAGNRVIVDKIKVQGKA